MCIKRLGFQAKSKLRSILTGMSNSAVEGQSPTTGASRTNNKLVIRNNKVFTFWKDAAKKKSMQITLCNINDEHYIGLDKFFFSEERKLWFPQTKGHFYMTHPQWTAFLRAAKTADNDFNEQIKSGQASIGT